MDNIRWSVRLLITFVATLVGGGFCYLFWNDVNDFITVGAGWLYGVLLTEEFGN